MLAPVYVNDFTDGGRVKRVTMQADSEFRIGPDSLSRFYTPAPNQSASAEGPSGEGTAMIPISNVADSRWTTASPSLSRYNEIGRAHVCTPVPNAHIVCRLL